MKEPHQLSSDVLQGVVARNALLNLFEDYIPLPCFLVPRDAEYYWYSLSPYPRGLHPLQFELYFGQRKKREVYTQKCFQKLSKARRPLLGCHQGFYDLYVPIFYGKRLMGYVVSGSFSKVLPTEAWLKDQWKNLSGREPGIQDLEFLTYVRVALDTPVLNGKVLAGLTQVLECAAELAVDGHGVKSATEKIRILKSRVFSRQLPTRMFRYVSAKRDRLSWGPWDGDILAPWDQEEFGLTRHPNTVLAARPTGLEGPSHEVTRMVEATRLQRFAFEWSLGEKETMAGQLEGEGCFLLTFADSKKSQAQAKLQIRDLCERFTQSVSKSLKLKVAIGVSRIGGAVEEMPEYFNQALMALRVSGHMKQSPFFFGDFPKAPEAGLYGLSRSLVEAMGRGQEGQVSLARGQFLQEALRLSGGSTDAFRAHLSHLFYLAWDEMRRRSVLSEEEFKVHQKDLEEKLTQAFSMEELLERFREEVDQLVRLFQSPAEGNRLERLESAKRFMALNCRRKLTVGEVAKEAGFSVSRFSHLFHEVYGESFIDAFTKLRCEEAGRLLKTTYLSISQIAQTCGFGTASHFSHIFKARMGTTPAEYREKVKPESDRT